MSDIKYCNYCKIDRPIKYFSKNRKDIYNKSCDDCRAKQKINRNKYKCPHDREKSKCIECGGSSICEHKRRKTQCRECGGGSICEHNKRKSNCIECGGVSICIHYRQKSRCKECNDPIKITISNWINQSKDNDIKYNRYKNEEYIDYDFCLGLIDFYKHCYHCSVELQYIKYQDNLASIERLDNSIEHNKNNCVLACLKCNKKKITNK